MQFGNLAGVHLHFGGAIVRWSEQPLSPTPTHAKGLYSLFTHHSHGVYTYTSPADPFMSLPWSLSVFDFETLLTDSSLNNHR